MGLPSPQNELWTLFMEFIRDSIPPESYQTWFTPMKLVKFEDNELTVQVPNRFFFDWIEQHYSVQIRKALENVYGEGSKLTYSILEKNGQGVHKLGPSKAAIMVSNKPAEGSQLNPRYTFNNFIEGDSNSFAKAASLAAAEAPGRTKFNPLVIYGGVGLGKTHLVQAIGNFALQNKTSKRIFYLSSEKFTNDFINSVKQNKSSEFTNMYRSADLLMVDDVQFFSGKERTQMEFFHTFNTIYQSGKQVVLSMDRPPSELTDIEARLLSRFQCGLVTDIQPPDFETRVAILQKRADDDNLNLDIDILEYIAANITNNVRELEGSLIRLMAHSSITGQDIDLFTAKRLLKDVLKSRTRVVPVEHIQNISAEYFRTLPDLLKGASRKKEIVLARQTAMYLCSELTDMTLKSIGAHFGNRDHSTVIHSLETIKAQMDSSLSFKNEVSELRKRIEIQL